MGPWSATGFLQDGSLTHMEFGTHLPRPEWVPFYPGALTVQASKLTSVTAPSGFHSLEIATRASLDDVKRFYTAALTTSASRSPTTASRPLNPATAAMLGMAGTLRRNTRRDRRAASTSRSAPPTACWRRGCCRSAGARSARRR